MKEIGQVMSYTESRISQLHTKSVVRLRGKIKRYFEHRGTEAPKGPSKGKPEGK
jgi:hypothetical protein